jgi:SNF2 family DNA or RNA helicase
MEKQLLDAMWLRDDVMAVPHTVYNTRLMHRLGYAVPAPVLSYYDWRGQTPFVAQKATAALLTTEPRAFVLSSFGTGKTRAAIFAFDYLRREKVASKMLVIAPLSTLHFTWAREIMQTCPELRVLVLHGGTAASRRKHLASTDWDVVVINFAGVPSVINALCSAPFDVVCVDEASACRNHTTTRHKTVARVCANRRFVWAMTGSPTPRTPSDAYGLLKLVKPLDPRAKSYKRFRDAVEIKQGQFRWVSRPNAEQTVFEALQPAVRFKLADCVDLPPVVYLNREVELSVKQARAYEELRKTAVLKHEAGTLVAAHEAALMIRLAQVASGALEVEGKLIDLEAGPRYEEMAAVAESAERNVLVFCPFRHNLPLAARALEDVGFAVDVVNGDTPSRDRADIFSRFMSDTARRAIVATPGTMSHGLTLTSASTVIWLAPITDLEIYEQANARVNRPGQTANHVQVVHMVGSPIERRLYRMLRDKHARQAGVLSLFEEGTRT